MANNLAGIKHQPASQIDWRLFCVLGLVRSIMCK